DAGPGAMPRHRWDVSGRDVDGETRWRHARWRGIDCFNTTAPPWVLRVRDLLASKLNGSATISARGLIAGSPGWKRELGRYSEQRSACATVIGRHCDAVAGECIAARAWTSAVMCTATSAWRDARAKRPHSMRFRGKRSRNRCRADWWRSVDMQAPDRPRPALNDRVAVRARPAHRAGTPDAW